MASRLVTSANKIELRDVVPGALAQSTLTISSGAVTPTRHSHVVAAESGTADDLATITLTNLRAGDVGELVVDAGDTITVKNSGGNITCDTGGDIIATAGQTIQYRVNAAASGVVATLVGGGGAVIAQTSRQVSSGNLASAAHAINTAGKSLGSMALDTTNNRAYFALGALATSAWRPFDDQSGTSDVTPA